MVEEDFVGYLWVVQFGEVLCVGIECMVDVVVMMVVGDYDVVDIEEWGVQLLFELGEIVVVVLVVVVKVDQEVGQVVVVFGDVEVFSGFIEQVQVGCIQGKDGQVSIVV